MQRVELIKPFADHNVIVYDIETYPNFFLANFWDGSSFQKFTLNNVNESRVYLNDPTKILVGYNNISFDDVILKAIYYGKIKNEKDIYQLAQDIIDQRRSSDSKPLIKQMQYKAKTPWYNSCDLMEIYKGNGKVGPIALKDMAVRIQWPWIQDLPYEHSKFLTHEEMDNVSRYCDNDVMITSKLWNIAYKDALLRIDLEKRYGVNVLGKSKAAAAEAIFESEYSKRTGIDKFQLKAMVKEYDEINLGDLIPNTVQFKTKSCKEVLTKFKSKTLYHKGNGKWDSIGKGNKVKIANKSYKIGIGGLHSEDDPGLFTKSPSQKIIDVDVTSYYPSILLNLEAHPRHLTSEWTNILREITEERIKAKKAGDKSVSDALKIVINSIFGKTGDKHSFVYDKAVMLQVTLYGQLCLLMLIEDLTEKGIEVISANTDGITTKVKTDQEDLFNKTCKAWESKTNFNLEYVEYEIYARTANGKYLAKDLNGYVKTRGVDFNYTEDFEKLTVGELGNKKDRNAVTKAVCRYICEGIPIEKTIKESKNILDFCYSYKTDRRFVTIYDGIELQKTNRWYYSEVGKRIVKKSLVGSKDEKAGSISAIPNGYRVEIINQVNCKFPTALDYAHYINSAEEIVSRIIGKNIVTNFNGPMDKKANEIRALGLKPIPKDQKKNPVDSKLDEIKEDWHFDSYNGIGIYTGDKVGTIVIDIDKPELFNIQDMIVDTMTVWHGKGGRQDVQEGKKGGSLIYKCHNGYLRSYAGKLRKKHGFEIIYGKKTSQIWGLHTSGEEYTYEGQLVDIPQELEEFLLHNTPKTKTKAKKLDKNTGNLFDVEDKYEVSNEGPEEYTENDYTALEDLIDRVIGSHEIMRVEDSDYPFKVQGFCPFSDEHSSKSASPSNFDIVIKPGMKSPKCHCWHESCSESVKKLNKKLAKEWHEEYRRRNVRKIQEIELPPIEVDAAADPQEDTIYNILRSSEKHLIFEAPTGAGKTYESALFFLECLKDQQAVTYIASNKTELYQFSNTLRQMANNRTLDELYTQILQGGEKIEDETDIDGNVCISKNTIGVITHHTYLQRKGISDVFYTYQNWIKNTSCIALIDEVDNFINIITHIIQIGARFKKQQMKGAENPTYRRVSACPANNKSGNCGNCIYRQYQHYEVDQYSIPRIVTRSKLTHEEFNNPKKLDVPDLTFGKPVTIKNRIVAKRIQNHENYLESKKKFKFHLADGEYFDFQKSIRDMIDSSFMPTIYKEYPYWKENGEIIKNPQEVEYDPHKIQYPHGACGVPHLSLRDMAPIEIIKRHAKKSRWFSARISEPKKEFLRNSIPGIAEFKVKQSKKKIDDLLIITVETGVPILESKKHKRIFFEDLQDFGKVLVFAPKMRTAEELFKAIPKDFSCGFYKEGAINLFQEKFTEGRWKALISYSRGPIGRGINLEEYVTSIISGLIYKPAICYNLDEHTEEEINKQAEEDRLDTLYQNAGRILRGDDGRKVIILHNCESSDGEWIKNEIIPMVRGEIQLAHFVEDTDEVKRCAYIWLKDGIVKCEEKSRLQKAKEASVKNKTSLSSQVGPSVRKKIKKDIDATKEAKKAARDKKKFDALVEKAREWSDTWEKFRVKNNVARLKRNDTINDDQIQQLKDIVNK